MQILFCNFSWHDYLMKHLQLKLHMPRFLVVSVLLNIFGYLIVYRVLWGFFFFLYVVFFRPSSGTVCFFSTSVFFIIISVSSTVQWLSLKRFPENDRIRPTLGNGHIATVVYTDTIYMNGLYNGLRVFSHRARIPSTCAIKIVSTTTRITKSSYSLDIEKGAYPRKLIPSFLYFFHNSLERYNM